MPKVDGVVKQNLTNEIRDTDTNVAKLQTLTMDTMAPVVHILEEAQGGSLTAKTAIDAAGAGLALLGNVSAHIKCKRKKQVLRDPNNDLLHRGRGGIQGGSASAVQQHHEGKPETQIFYHSTIVNQLKCMGIAPTPTELARPNLPLAGRARHFLPNSVKLTQDPWKLEAVQGFRVPFTQQPFQKQPPKPLRHSEAEENLLQEEIQSMIAIEDTTPKGHGFLSMVFWYQRWRSETSNESKKSEQICSHRTH